jgi:maleate isomerase
MQDLASTKSEAGWERVAPRYGEGVGHRAAIGLLVLATDRVSAMDTEEFARRAGVSIFSTRVPMMPVATPETLAAMGQHLTSATALLVPGSKLDVVGFSCTSGTVAIGVEKVKEAIKAARPGVHVTTPIEAGYEGLRRLGIRRISLLAPYLVSTAELVGGFFAENNIEVVRRATFGLDGDPDMNRLAPQALIEAALATDSRDADAVFISCTGLRTAPIVVELEQRLGKPVVTSNQALAWHSLRLAGVNDPLPGRGVLFTVA